MGVFRQSNSTLADTLALVGMRFLVDLLLTWHVELWFAKLATNSRPLLLHLSWPDCECSISNLPLVLANLLHLLLPNRRLHGRSFSDIVLHEDCDPGKGPWLPMPGLPVFLIISKVRHTFWLLCVTDYSQTHMG